MKIMIRRYWEASKPEKDTRQLAAKQTQNCKNKKTGLLSRSVGIFMALTVFAVLGCNNTAINEKLEGPVKVELKKEANGYQLFVEGDPFYIRGAGFEGPDPSSVAAHGGNAIRTWRTGDEHIGGQQILDEAYQNGLMVCMGIEIARERHGFDYDDPDAVQQQFEDAKKEVLKYKDHPALLAWGIGNELNLHYSNKKVWDAVNDISLMIKSLDPNHLTTTMLAGAGKEDVLAVIEQCPSLDFLSFQLYGNIVNLPQYIAESGYAGAYVVSEWGATGHWESPLTEWGRPIEQNSHEKAMAYKERYEKVIAADTYHCLGSFVFLWGQKQERTPTWYGMFLESGDNTESVDVMQYLWTGSWPENRSPQLHSITMDGRTAHDHIYMTAGENFHAEVLASDPDNDPLTYHWEIIPEVPEHQQSDGGDFEPRPATVFTMDSDENAITISAPLQKGDYRLFIYVFDGHNNAATANIPFYVNDRL
ncbi:MAG: glycoside hydrolase family 2 TIM barrel-domain containing protein [Bacteroidales bacterium]